MLLEFPQDFLLILIVKYKICFISIGEKYCWR